MSQISENALDLLRKRYFRENEKTWNDLCYRVCEGIVQAEEKENQEKWLKIFHNMMNNMEFIVGTPCLINADKENNGQLSSCFIISIKDNIESINQAEGECMKIFQKNGGVGFNISTLRPKGTAVETSKGYSCGTIGFMEIFDLTADVVTRNNIRKGAIKIDLNDWHPDILDFINCKDDTTKLNHMNISVSLSDKFMNAVKNDENWNLIFPDYSLNKDLYNSEWDGDIDKWISKKYPIKIYKTLKARELYTNIMEHSWKTGEPGVSFRDSMNLCNPNPHLGRVDSTNPCSEFNSIPYNSCNLGSINLSVFVRDNQFDWGRFEIVVKNAIRFLDNMITVNKLPLDKISKITKDVRSVGLGIMGLADCLYLLKLPYNTTEGYDFINKLFNFMRKTAEEYSIELAKEKGVYPAWNGSTWEQNNIKIRNSNFLSIAPTGSISFLANTSGGLEPNFALTYSRKTNEGDLYYITNQYFEQELKNRGIYSKELLQKIIDNKGSCVGVKTIPEDIQKIFIVASDITPKQHAEVVGIIQKYVDLACSKTINMPNSATIKDIEDIYMYSWKLGCKGITVYRDGCRENQTLSVNRNEKELENKIKFDSIEPITKDELGETYGSCVKEKVACGNLYLSLYRDIEGNLSEMFINTSKGGICQSNVNAVSRLVSLALRSGIKVESICDQLMGIKCPACTILRSQGESIETSCPNAVGQYILEKYKQGNTMIVEKIQRKKKQFKNNKMKCPNCGEQMRMESGCIICNCGFSKCG